MLSDDVVFHMDSDLNGASPQFTLTCISIGGPATTVTWTRDSEMLTGSTVLNDAETAQYTHTLTVTGRLGGLYTCTVSNDKPSEDSAQLNIQGMLPCIWYPCIDRDSFSAENQSYRPIFHTPQNVPFLVLTYHP